MERDPQIIRGYKWHVNKNWKVKEQFGGRIFLYKEPGWTYGISERNLYISLHISEWISESNQIKYG